MSHNLPLNQLRLELQSSFLKNSRMPIMDCNSDDVLTAARIAVELSQESKDAHNIFGIDATTANISEAVEQGKPGVYEATVECVPYNGARTLSKLVLMGRESSVWKRSWAKSSLESDPSMKLWKVSIPFVSAFSFLYKLYLCGLF
ncbi:hypothetical protein Tco_0648830 [Tanacetum coccineum]